MELEFSLEDCASDERYEFEIRPGSRASESLIDWTPLVKGILHDASSGTSTGLIAARFHNTLVETIVAMARHIGQPKVVLSGGCFQNRFLIEHAVHRLQSTGFRPYWHQRIPPNDGGIALGQVVAALRPMEYK
jgi:hydrogenase maturation protein HypF